MQLTWVDYCGVLKRCCTDVVECHVVMGCVASWVQKDELRGAVRAVVMVSVDKVQSSWVGMWAPCDVLKGRCADHARRTTALFWDERLQGCDR